MDDDIQIDGGEPLGDDFYEKIEAPKFVDLTAPDRFRPSYDDRYWFCLRVGCDRKHEEEMDPEEINKNFFLRVMAARSPNVRLRKALYGRDSSANVKCPLTVPAKSSKSRVSRLALISSMSKKVVDGEVKGRGLPKQGGTPNRKEKQLSVAAKSLTTPRNRKRLSNHGTFRSVRNPKPTSIAVPKSRIVAKALVFHSPKKTVKIKTSQELSTRMRSLCAGMKKLEITSGKKPVSTCKKPVPVDASRKQFKGREVKSRIYDSLRSQNCRAKETTSSKCLKKKEKEQPLPSNPVSREETENDSSDMEIEGKSKNCSLEVCSTSNTSKSNERHEHEECLVALKVENESEAISDISGSDTTPHSNCGEENTTENDVPYLQAVNGEGSKTEEGSDNEKQIKSSPEKWVMAEVTGNDEKENAADGKENDSGEENTTENAVPYLQAVNGASSKTKEGSDNATQIKSSPEKWVMAEVTGNDEKENAADDKENDGGVMNEDDKENGSSSDDNRKLNQNTSHMEKEKTLGKHETSKTIQRVNKGMSKTKGNSTTAVTCPEGVNYRKPKLTNPKPFRLRTDERQILKEANLEKKLHRNEPLKEITPISKFPGGNLHRRHQNAVVQRNEKCLEQIECASDAHESAENESERTKPLKEITPISKFPGGNLHRRHQNSVVQRNEKCLEQIECASYAHESAESESERTKQKDQPQRMANCCSQAPNGDVERKQSPTPQRHTSEGSLKRTKSPYMKQLAKTRGIESSRKKAISLKSPGQLGVIKESSPTIVRTKVVSKTMDNGASPATKALASASSKTPSLGRKLTTPKEPHFHSVHVPKSCVRRVA